MIIDFFLYLYSFLLAMLYTLGIIKEEFKQSDTFALVTALVLHIPYLYIYLYKDSEKLVYGLLTEGINVLVPIYLYFSLDRNNADFFSILLFTAALALPTLTLFSRQFFSSNTCARVPRIMSWLVCRPTDETLALIKPDGMQYKDDIIQILVEDHGFDIVDDIELTLTPQLVATWYSDKLEKPYYPDLEKYMTSGPVQVLRLSRRKAIKKLRNIVGPTDAEVARKKYKDTIRGRFGTNIQQNAIHASDSKKSAKKEIGLFWDDKKGNIKGRSKRTSNCKQQQQQQQATTMTTDADTMKKLDLIWNSVQSIQRDINNKYRFVENNKGENEKEEEGKEHYQHDSLNMETNIFDYKVNCSCPLASGDKNIAQSVVVEKEVVTHDNSYYILSLVLSFVVIVLFVWNAHNERKQRKELTKALNKIQNELDSLNKNQSKTKEDSKKA